MRVHVPAKPMSFNQGYAEETGTHREPSLPFGEDGCTVMQVVFWLLLSDEHHEIVERIVRKPA